MTGARLKEEENLSLFRGNLKMTMAERGLKQKDLAALSGLTEAQVSCYLKGRSEPGLRSLCRLAYALGISPALLLCPARERLVKDARCWNEEDGNGNIDEGESKK